MQTSPTSPLIGVAELASQLDELVVLDVRWRLGGPPGEPEYLRGHIPGAAYVDLPTALASAPGSRGRHPLPDPEPQPYVLKSGDVIAIRFWGNSDLDEEVLVRPDGRVSLPFVDEVDAAGLTLTELDQETFWERIGTALARRGWGSVTHEAIHPGVGLLTSSDWAEALGGQDESQPSCSFSTGLLSGLLSGAAGGPIAVLEVTCRAKGDGRCSFAFGSAATVHDLYGLLLDGRPLESALSVL